VKVLPFFLKTKRDDAALRMHASVPLYTRCPNALLVVYVTKFDGGLKRNVEESLNE